MLTGILLLVAFLIVVAAIVRGQSPIIMLLLLAIVWAAAGGHRHQRHPVQDPAGRRRGVCVCGDHHRIRRVVRAGADPDRHRRERDPLGGRADRRPADGHRHGRSTWSPRCCSPRMYGVGAAIAIGVIALPIMMSQGIPARVAAPGVHHGRRRRRVRQPGAVRHLREAVSRHQVRSALADLLDRSAWWCTSLIAWLMIWLNLRKLGVRHAASWIPRRRTAPRKRTPYYTYLVPIFPVFMIMVFKWQIIPTFLSHRAGAGADRKERSFQGTSEPVQQDFLRRLSRYRHHRRAVDHLRHDHRRRADAAGRRTHCGRSSIRSCRTPRCRRRCSSPCWAASAASTAGRWWWSAPVRRCWRSSCPTTRSRCLICMRCGSRPTVMQGSVRSDQFLDAVDHRLHQGAARAVPENGIAVRLPDGRRSLRRSATTCSAERIGP